MHCIARTINDVQLCVLGECEHQNLVHASTLFANPHIMRERIELEYQNNRVSTGLQSFTDRRRKESKKKKPFYIPHATRWKSNVRNSSSSSSSISGTGNGPLRAFCVRRRNLLAASSDEPAAISLLSFIPKSKWFNDAHIHFISFHSWLALSLSLSLQPS